MSPDTAQWLFGTPATMSRLCLSLLGALLLLAAASDIRSRRIPNSLTLGGLIFAVLLHAILPAGDGLLAALPGGLGADGALLGAGGVLLALLPLFWLRLLGGGDVKLLAMTGAFLGPREIWPALLATVLAGGLLSLAMAARHGLLSSTWQNVRRLFLNGYLAMTQPGSALPAAHFAGAAQVPYGAAIAAGCLITIGWRAHALSLL